MASPAHARLRAATAADHARLEGRLDILSRIRTPAGRRELVVRFWRLHAEAEAAAAPWLANVESLDFEARRRTAVLRGDLQTLQLAPPVTGYGPRLASLGEAMGLMYVLEGSTLGGKVIRREVEAAGGDMAGLAFLDPYGARTGERWRTFLSLVDGLPPEDGEAVVAGALAGFRHAELRLCGEAMAPAE